MPSKVLADGYSTSGKFQCYVVPFIPRTPRMVSRRGGDWGRDTINQITGQQGDEKRTVESVGQDDLISGTDIQEWKHTFGPSLPPTGILSLPLAMPIQWGFVAIRCPYPILESVIAKEKLR